MGAKNQRLANRTRSAPRLTRRGAWSSSEGRAGNLLVVAVTLLSVGREPSIAGACIGMGRTPLPGSLQRVMSMCLSGASGAASLEKESRWYLRIPALGGSR